MRGPCTALDVLEAHATHRSHDDEGQDDEVRASLGGGPKHQVHKLPRLEFRRLCSCVLGRQELEWLHQEMLEPERKAHFVFEPPQGLPQCRCGGRTSAAGLLKKSRQLQRGRLADGALVGQGIASPSPKGTGKSSQPRSRQLAGLCHSPSP